MQQSEFERIIERTQAPIRAYIAGLGVPPHAVDDVAQEVYMAWVQGDPSQPAEVSDIAWLKGIARNQVYAHFRSERRERARRLEALARRFAEVDDSEAADSEAATTQALHVCLGRLSEDERLLISLRYQQGLDADGIASIRRSSAGAIRVALMRIRDRLRLCVHASLAQAP